MKNLLFLFTMILATVNIKGKNGDETKRTAVKTITGKVISATGEEITGARIQVNGTSYYSGMHGEFSFNLKSGEESQIVIDGIGFAPKTVKSRELSPISEIMLQEL